MAQGFSLKDQLFNAGKVRYLAGLFAAAQSDFDAAGFEREVMARLPDLELKARIGWIADRLDAHLPGALPDVAPVVLRAVPPPLDPDLNDDDFGDFIFAPLGELVVRKGLEDHPDLSLDLLEALTQRFSMEWAIRPFLNRWSGPVLARMRDWTAHPNYHVRRLVSEGTRPRLPWGQAVGLALTDPLPLLDRLHADPTRYVTRSVSNHLNDIAKKDPDLAMDQLEDWRGRGLQRPAELDWMTRNALRGLVKAGHPRALAMLGYEPGADLHCTLVVEGGAVPIGGVLAFSARIEAPRDTPVLVDYRIGFARPDGRQSVRVFKLGQAVARAGVPLVLDKRHRLKGDATTYRLHPGRHRIELQVNGLVRAEAAFDVSPD